MTPHTLTPPTTNLCSSCGHCALCAGLRMLVVFGVNGRMRSTSSLFNTRPPQPYFPHSAHPPPAHPAAEALPPRTRHPQRPSRHPTTPPAPPTTTTRATPQTHPRYGPHNAEPRTLHNSTRHIPHNTSLAHSTTPHRSPTGMETTKPQRPTITCYDHHQSQLKPPLPFNLLSSVSCRFPVKGFHFHL
nr:gibberellin-regulated protein 14-like [Penaeus vannamei]